MRREPSFDPDWSQEEDIRPLSPPRRFSRARLAIRCVAAAAIVAGLTVAARDKLTSRAAPTPWMEPARAEPTARAVAPRSREIAAPLLHLDVPPGEASARAETPHWNTSTGLREDAVSAGSFTAIDARFLRVILAEVRAGSEPSGSLFVTLARRAAEVQGLAVVRTGLRGRIESKFGMVETVEAVLAGDGRRSCLGFQRVDARAVRIDGWLCGILGQAPEPREVSCLIDRLALAGPADPVVEAAFTEADSRRGAGCDGSATAGAGETDRTGSIGRRPHAAKGRSRKNEAGMRQID